MKASSATKSGALALATLFACLMLAEVVVRLAFPEFRPPEEHPFFVSTRAGIELGPANRRFDFVTSEFRTVYEFNKYGFRDRRDLVRADPDDLFVVGDSFSLGFGVAEADRYSEVLERLTESRTFNLSIPADIQQYWRLVRYAELVGAPIRRLIVGICMENDVRRYTFPVGRNVAWSANVASVMKEIADTKPPTLDFTTLFGWKLFLSKHVALYGLVTRAVKSQPWLAHKFVGLGLVGNFSFSTDDDKLAVASTLAMIEPFLERYETTILIVPSRALWTGPLESRLLAAATHDAIVNGLKHLAADVVDPRPAMEVWDDPLSFHFSYDGHWNEEGHRLAAKLLANHLRGQQTMARD